MKVLRVLSWLALKWEVKGNFCVPENWWGLFLCWGSGKAWCDLCLGDMTEHAVMGLALISFFPIKVVSLAAQISLTPGWENWVCVSPCKTPRFIKMGVSASMGNTNFLLKKNLYFDLKAAVPWTGAPHISWDWENFIANLSLAPNPGAISWQSHSHLKI